MRKFLNWLKSLFSLHCQDCGGVMKSEFFDMDIDHMVYKCENCGKEWI